MKQSINKIDIELKNDQFIISFNKPNYTYQYATIDQMEELWQALMQICHEYRRNEQIVKVSN